jgi:hypothetical protein
MPEYLLPFHDIDPAELLDYLDENGIQGSAQATAESLLLTTTQDAQAALDTFTPTSKIDNSTFPPTSTYRARPRGPIRQHLQHMRDYRDAVRAGTPAMTAAQTQHALADVIDALYHLNASLEDREIT